MRISALNDTWDKVAHKRDNFIKLAIQHPLNIKVGYSFDGKKSLIVETEERIANNLSTYAVAVDRIELIDHSHAIEFRLLKEEFIEEFSWLCWDMIRKSQKSISPMKSFIRRYMMWQKLLQEQKTSTMSFQEQKGLLGELLFICESLEEGVSPQDIVQAWCGPEGRDQDFQFDGGWAEIKSISLAAQVIKVSSLEQLKQEVEGHIVVFILEAAEHNWGAISLNGTVDKIRHLLENTSDTLDEFNVKLFKCGYKEKDRDAYDKTLFRYIEKRKYGVTDAFPRLTRGNVPSEIVACKYDISLAAIESFREK
ncbi:MAG: PD-(D/E)XK motif protein [Veillonella sp.]|uniref:PD-(D/E)XK motif protein n=1 Tax=Veillonella sp. TaxID=1926307 RepID=UPI0025D3A64D|nr:PD-(D/E)XK motif protein [Veillonella sp.]MBS4913477.1 PD-(D/E)XK motif protein [Veillonella sp.]